MPEPSIPKKGLPDRKNFRSSQSYVPDLDPVKSIPADTEQDWEEPARTEKRAPFRLQLHWIAIAVFLIFLASAWTIRPWKRRRATEAMPQLLSKAELGEQLDSKIDIAHSTIQKFLRASTVAEKQRHVRSPDRVLPLMINWYSSHPHNPLEVAQFEMMATATLNGKPFWVALVLIKDGPRQTLMLEDTPDGFKIDWEAYSAYNPTTLKQLIKQRPPISHHLRVYATAVDYYPEEFSEKEFLSLKLECRNQPEVVYGYVSRKAPFYRNIAAVTKGKKRIPIQVELQLRETDNSHSAISNLTLVKNFISSNWLRLD